MIDAGAECGDTPLFFASKGARVYAFEPIANTFLRLQENIQINLAVSIHAPDNKTRSETVPINKRYPIEELIKSCNEYIRITNRKIFFEYVMLDGQNDTLDHAKNLGKLLSGMLCHVNLIPVNPTNDSEYQRSRRETIKAFQSKLGEYNVPSTVRMEKGIEVSAGCGQLAKSNFY